MTTLHTPQRSDFSADDWATLERVPGRDLARILAMVKKHAGKELLPRISTLSKEEQLAAEDRNVRRSVEFARSKLGLVRT